jgi:hypothetical protein
MIAAADHWSLEHPARLAFDKPGKAAGTSEIVRETKGWHPEWTDLNPTTAAIEKPVIAIDSRSTV